MLIKRRVDDGSMTFIQNEACREMDVIEESYIERGGTVTERQASCVPLHSLS